MTVAVVIFYLIYLSFFRLAKAKLIAKLSKIGPRYKYYGVMFKCILSEIDDIILCVMEK